MATAGHALATDATLNTLAKDATLGTLAKDTSVQAIGTALTGTGGIKDSLAAIHDDLGSSGTIHGDLEDIHEDLSGQDGVKDMIAAVVGAIEALPNATQEAADNANAAAAAATAAVAQLGGLVAETYSNSRTYSAGDFAYYNGYLYRCVEDITTAEAWTAAHWAKVAVGNDVTGNKASLAYNQSKLYSYFHESEYVTTGTWTSGATVFESISLTKGQTYVFEITNNAATNGYVYLRQGETSIKAQSVTAQYFAFEYTPGGNYTVNIYVGWGTSGISGALRFYEKPLTMENVKANIDKTSKIEKEIKAENKIALDRITISNTGVNSASTIRLGTQDFIELDDRSAYTVKVPTGTANGIWFNVQFWDEIGNTNVGIYTGVYNELQFTPKANWKYMKISVGKDSNETITLEDVSYIAVIGNAVEGAYKEIETLKEETESDQFYPQMVSGSFDDKGANSTASTRLRSDFIELIPDVLWTVKFPKGKTGFEVSVSVFSNNDGNTLRDGYYNYTDEVSFIPTKLNKYMRIVVKKSSNENITVKEIPYLIVCKSGLKAKTNYTEIEVEANRNSAKDGLVSQIDGTSSWGNSSYASGMCMVHGFLFQFGVADDAHETQGKCFVYEHENNFKFKKKSSFYLLHNFGHVNTVSYNEYDDCLVFGNGSGSYSLAGEFYVYPNFWKRYTEGTLEFDIDDAINYKLSDADITGEVQCNAIWGADNAGKHDLIYVITNDNQKIRLIQLGKGENDLGSGAIQAASTGEFNGTFKVQKLYTQDVGEIGPSAGQSVEYCVQDACYRNGKIYAGIGHGHFEYWIMTPNTDGTITREAVTVPMYLADGTEATYGVAAIELTDDYLIVNTSGNRLISTYKL